MELVGEMGEWRVSDGICAPSPSPADSGSPIPMVARWVEAWRAGESGGQAKM